MKMYVSPACGRGLYKMNEFSFTYPIKLIVGQVGEPYIEGYINKIEK